MKKDIKINSNKIECGQTAPDRTVCVPPPYSGSRVLFAWVGCAPTAHSTHSLSAFAAQNPCPGRQTFLIAASGSHTAGRLGKIWHKIV
jgi:hypothetical protein